MDDGTKAIVIGLSAGIGGFVGLLILFCICWQIVCGSCCESKNDQLPVRSIPVKSQRRATAAIKGSHRVSNAPVMKSIVINPGLKTSSSNDLASKVNGTRQ